MKGLLRSNAVQAVLGWLSWLYLELVLRTIRWTRIGEAPGEPIYEAVRAPGGFSPP